VQTVGNPRKRLELIERDSQLSIRSQCRLLHIHRSMIYYDLSDESEENLDLMEKIDHLYLEDPSAGSRRLRSYLKRQTRSPVNRKRVSRLMRKMGIEAIYPRKRTTIPGGPSGIYPYRLKGLKIARPNQVWCADITFIPMRRGYMYLFAIMDWHSRMIIDWELSNTLDLSFCLDCLKRSTQHSGIPEIMNTDQGSQFTSDQWISYLKDTGITISMDGKGRWLDNVTIERFWRSIKYEDIYLKSYEKISDLAKGVESYITRYNQYRPHQSLNEATPEEIYSGKMEIAV
jgi:putative transposase